MLLACVLVAVIVAAYLWRRFGDLPRAGREVFWAHAEWVDYPAPVFRDAVVACFGKGEHKHLKPEGTLDVYARGDPRVNCVSSSDATRWVDLPGFFSVLVAPIDGKTFVTLEVRVLERVKMCRTVMDRFAASAQSEFDQAIAALKRAAARRQQADSSQQQERQERAAPVTPDCLTDYAVLGVRPDASFDEVRAAYRDACRKYHPDALTGKNVEPHLVDLAARRFKEVSTAYGRLRDRLAPSGRA